MMHMTMYWGREITLLVESWKTESWTSYSLTLLFCFLLSLFHQRLESHRFKLKSPKPTPSSVNVPLISRRFLGDTRSIRIVAAVMFGVTSAIGYVIMLAIMSYNGGVFVAVVLGLSIGYFLFRSEGLVVEDEDVAVAVEDNTCACS